MTPSQFAAIADLARAFATLRPDDDWTRRKIAALLGIAAPEEEKPAVQPPGTHRYVRVADAGRGEDTVERREIRLPLSRGSAEIPVTERPPELASVLTPDYSARSLPAWLNHAQPLAGPAAEPLAPPDPDPLFEPRWTRAILSGALSTSGEGGLDLETLTSEVARRRPLLQLPRRVAPTLARGVQVLVDRGERMLPFSVDLVQLIEQIRTVAGRETVEVFAFDGLPSRGAGPRSRRHWRPYPDSGAPRPGAAVAVVTDLGLGSLAVGSRAAGPADWLSLAQRLGRTGNPLVAFVPYGPDHWPPELLRALTLVHWDHRTTAGDVRRALARGRRALEGLR
jgi:hypothetical protein